MADEKRPEDAETPDEAAADGTVDETAPEPASSADDAATAGEAAAAADDTPAAAEEAAAGEAPAAPEEAPAVAGEAATGEAPGAPEEAPAAAGEAAAEEAPAAEVTPTAADEAAAPAAAAGEEVEDEVVEEAPREKPAIPGMDLEVDIVREGEDYLRGERGEYDEDYEEAPAAEPSEEEAQQPITQASIDLAAGARYRATGKRKTSVARVILKPGTGAYTINGRTLEQHFPRNTLQRNIRQPLETVGYDERMDVVAKLHGGGVSAQAGALRHGISRALIEADPNLRSDLKRRGFLTRDARVKERKKAGLKKARKRPQFSKR
jgi:small subunit ribosomal protein S9